MLLPRAKGLERLARPDACGRDRDHPGPPYPVPACLSCVPGARCRPRRGRLRLDTRRHAVTASGWERPRRDEQSRGWSRSSVDGLNPVAIKRLGEARRTDVPHRLMLGRSIHPQCAQRGRADPHAAQPHRHGDQPPRGQGVWWARRGLERRPAGAAHRAGRCGPPGRVGVLVAFQGEGLRRARCSRPRRSSPSSTRSWPNEHRRASVIDEGQHRAGQRDARRDLSHQVTRLHVPHISLPGRRRSAPRLAPHLKYWRRCSESDYLHRSGCSTTIEKTLGVARPPRSVLVTADHGGPRPQPPRPQESTPTSACPFFDVGPGMPAGADLYALDPTISRPRHQAGRRYGAAPPPIRNGDVANLAPRRARTSRRSRTAGWTEDQDLELFAQPAG